MGAVDLRPGVEISGYRLEALIGRGGMGAVYRARDPRLGRPVAIKFVAPELAQNEMFRRRFERESQMAAAIEHPNILPIYLTGESDGLLYIVMRYVEGTDLKALITGGEPLDPTRVLTILGQAAGALDTAHARGLVHRDVKPANILIVVGSDPSVEHVYLTDFGLTKRVSSDSGLTGTGQFVGTLDYAAPEQFEGKPLDGRTDVYSLGCVLFECLTGQVPFQRDQDAAVMFAHLQSPPPSVRQIRPDLSPAFDDVVATAMAKQQENRYATCQAMVSAARQALPAPAGPTVVVTKPRRAILPKRAPRPSGPRQPSGGTVGGPPPRRRRWPLVAAAVVVVAAAAVSSWLVFFSSPGCAHGTANSEIFVLQAGETCAKAITSGPGDARDPQWSPTGDRLVFSSAADGDLEIYTILSDGQGLRQLTNNSGDTEQAQTWSPDGTRIAFTSDKSGKPHIYWIGLTQLSWTELTAASAAKDGMPEWSPNPTAAKIVFVSDRDGKDDIWVMGADGSGQTDLTPALRDPSSDPHWSPDGARIVWVSGVNIWVMNADGTDQRQLTVSGKNSQPSWSPDGTKIAYLQEGNGSSDIYVMSSTTGSSTNITNDSRPQARPVWSPNGQLTFVDLPGPSYQLVMSNADGSGRKVLFTDPMQIKNPQWSAQNQLLVFTVGGQSLGGNRPSPTP